MCPDASAKNSNRSKIQQFYEGKVIFLTGGTGFLGKILIDKLLRTCPTVERIFLLMREKNGLTIEERLTKLLDDMVFARLKKENPEFAKRLSVVHGDLHIPNLGLSANHVALLSETVDIVVHSAATLRFDERLGVAITTNVAGTKQLCLLAQEMSRLKAFVYVSTAFSNCDSAVIPESVCLPPICPDTLILLSELLDEKMLDNIAPLLLGAKPNTYIYTKSAAEGLINRFSSTLPVAILRPSIVISTLSEPLPGWINNIQGPTGVVASASIGVLRAILCNDHAVANLVPVDYTANAILALAYSVATQEWHNIKEKNGLPVINFVSTQANNITWGQFGDTMEKYIRLYPSLNLMWYPFVLRPQSPWLSAVYNILLHYLPALVVDSLNTLCGRPARLRMLCGRLDKYSRVLRYFSCRHFQFQENNQRLLWESLEPQDQQEFPFHMGEISWEVMMAEYIRGCRQYLLREEPATVVKARRRLQLLYAVHLVTKGALLFVSARAIWNISKHIARGFILHVPALSGRIKS
uniref:Fatty acyl-CoA reductase n=1 Tax=Homalodisca liturata TaxID=320908 RepID=A0A1B6HPE2_9HEMI